jgi:site-specific DNA-cytosine methylase
MRLNAADYGVPQLRQRVFVVGEREGRKLTTPAATHVSPARERLLFEEGLPSYRTAWDALADVRPDSAEDLALKGKWAEILPSIPEGQNYLWHTGRMGCSLPIARRPRLPNGRGPSRRGSGRCRASTPRTRARARAIAPRHARFKPDSPPMDVYGPATRSYAMSRFEKRIRRPR